MLEEAYVSFETAKLLREKGFDEPIFEFYHNNKIKYARNKDGFRLSELDGTYYPHITQQIAMRWLREVHNANIELRLVSGLARDFYANSYEVWTFDIVSKPATKIIWGTDIPIYECYEEAVEAAIKYCLENLII